VISIILIAFILKQFENDKPKVVVVLKELNNGQFWDILKAGAEKGFQDFGVDGKVIAPSNEYRLDEQEKILKNVLEEKPDVLIVSLIDPSSISILNEFDKNNIPVLLVDTDLPWENKKSYIGTNNFDLGWKGGSLLASELQPSDKVALITGDEKNPELRERITGAKSSLTTVAIKIETHKTIQNNAEQARSAMEMILKDHPDVKGVYASSDVIAINAFETIEENGFDIPVMGTDGVTEMLNLIKGGMLSGSVAQNPYDMGYLGVETAVKVVKGINIDRNINSGVDIIIQDNVTHRLDFTQRIME
jgi:ribose transport system substrate-binding protein